MELSGRYLCFRAVRPSLVRWTHTLHQDVPSRWMKRQDDISGQRVENAETPPPPHTSALILSTLCWNRNNKIWQDSMEQSSTRPESYKRNSFYFMSATHGNWRDHLRFRYLTYFLAISHSCCSYHVFFPLKQHFACKFCFFCGHTDVASADPGQF